MVEIPEHLLRRAAEARAKAEAAKTSKSGATAQTADAATTTSMTNTAGSDSASTSKIPAHLLERSQAARAASEAGPTSATADTNTKIPVQPPTKRTTPPGTLTGPAGHTQRLLTVVKSGSIQDVKAKPQDKVHVWPHLLAAEFVSTLVITAFVFLFSVFVNAPLLELANFNQTPNPSKAPWYFLGLQELLTMFHPMVAGVTIPGVGLLILMLAPYIDKNPSKAPEDRKFAISLMTIHLMFWAVLVMIGSFFRGPGFNFVFPWDAGLFFEL